MLLHELQARTSGSVSRSTSLDVYVHLRDIPFNSSNTTLYVDPLEDKSAWLRAVVAVVSLLSMIGAVLIVLSYVCIPSIRTKSRQILLHLSVADFGVACANFIGVVVDFDKLIRNCENHHESGSHNSYCRHYVNVCTAQAFFAGFSTIASILWTLTLSVYIYLLVVHESRKMHSKIVYFCYVFCWGMPLLISMWLALTGEL